MFKKYLSGHCTPEEIETLFDRFHVDHDETELRRLIRKAMLQEEEAEGAMEARVAALAERVGNRLSVETRNRYPFRWKWLRIAVSLIAVMSIGAMIYLAVSYRQPPEPLMSEFGGEVLPGGNRATLKLADGRVIPLSPHRTGIVVGEEISYEDGSKVLTKEARHAATGINAPAQPLSVATPKGGTYQVILPDGSKVWLNSASSLTYHPPRSREGKRTVELEGEAFFEVSEREAVAGGRSVRIPFVVRTRNQEVEVLGTQFNVSAYGDDEETKTTLVKGTVNVVSALGGASSILKPNQQATLRGDELSVKTVDVGPFVEWKDGLFSFHETGLRDAMNQLSRWYDLTVTYEGADPGTYFFGKIRRDNSLSKVLTILKKSGLNFRIESSGGENRLIVLQ